jgi:hypothetical protein
MLSSPAGAHEPNGARERVGATMTCLPMPAPGGRVFGPDFFPGGGGGDLAQSASLGVLPTRAPALELFYLTCETCLAGAWKKDGTAWRASSWA